MHILSSYSTFPPTSLQNNLSLNYILMAYHVTAKLLWYKFNSGNLLNLCVLRWFHGIIMSSLISPKILSKQAVSFGTHFKITYHTIIFVIQNLVLLSKSEKFSQNLSLDCCTICDCPSENQLSSHLQIYHFDSL